ncbi:uncharacterized protein [Hyperolius riggenbachi]|uniref:uncharacterized protein isoform X2 n=1 Tax=Hyperolius riggenbachi TaxID=752182 RepID=UPI0035A3C738
MSMLNSTSYLSSIKAAQPFISMDPNLLRFPEVVLERIQIKIEDDPSVSINSDEEEASEAADTKPSEWPGKETQIQSKRDGSFYKSVRGSVQQARGRGARQLHKYGNSGSLSEAERGAGYRRGGKRRRGGWHHFGFRDRQQFHRKIKRVDPICMEEERQRGQRFNEEENEALVAGVLSHYKDLCGYSAVRGSAARKRQLWEDVANHVNSVASTYRTIEVCKKRYGDCRRVVKVKLAALEQQMRGRGIANEPIRFNNWEEKLRQKICAVMSGGGAQQRKRVLDSSEPTTLQVACPEPSETSSSGMLPSWAPVVETAGFLVQAPAAEAFSEGEEATSPLDVQIISEWSEEDATCTSAPQIQPEGVELPEPLEESKVFSCLDNSSSQYVSAPESAYMEQPYQNQQEDYTSLKQLTRTQGVELHKLREHVVEGNARIVQHLEGLASEVRELNTHVRQIHLNQAHFNLMFQNYLSDTKQFYGAMVQAMRNLQQAPSVSPMASPASSPMPSPKPHPAPAQANPLLLTTMMDYTTVSPSGSAEPASASSTGSELPVYPAQHSTPNPTTTPLLPQTH